MPTFCDLDPQSMTIQSRLSNVGDRLQKAVYPIWDFGSRQSAVCESLKRRLQIQQPVDVPVARPSDDQLCRLFPRRWKAQCDRWQLTRECVRQA